MLIEMLKNRNHRPCQCGSGRKYGKCCGDPAYLAAKRLASMRECGDCQACCELVGVQELGKPYAAKCEHQCTTGCAIYAARPLSCRQWECHWKLFHDLQPEWRPDKSGIMMHLAGIDENWTQIGLFVYECWEGAVKTMPHGLAEWIDNYSRERGRKVIIVLYGTRQGTSYPIAAQYPAQDTHRKLMGLAELGTPGFFLLGKKS
jgi:hypothetical protein